MPTIANLADSWEKLREEFENAPEVGYVWTINIDSDATMSALGLVSVDYHLKLSCSHVGMDMFGAWGGELAFETKSNLGGLKTLFAALGSAMKADGDVWFKNDRYLTRILPYRVEDEGDFIEDFVAPLCTPKPGATEAEALGTAMANSIIENAQRTAISGRNVSRKLLNEIPPQGFAVGYYTHMTEGDLSQYIKTTGLIGFVPTSAHAEVDTEGHMVTGAAHVFVPIVNQQINTSIEDEIECPFPYTLSIFSDGSVLFRVFNSNGGPFALNFIGKMDKIPVGETTKI